MAKDEAREITKIVSVDGEGHSCQTKEIESTLKERQKCGASGLGNQGPFTEIGNKDS